jgi:hypothetical protein
LSGIIGVGFSNGMLRLAPICSLLIWAAACQQPSSSSSEAANGKRVQPENGGGTGVDICDSYLAQYQACIIPQLSPLRAHEHLEAVQRQRDAWRDLAETAAKRESLARICRAAIATARQEFPTCTFSTG